MAKNGSAHAADNKALLSTSLHGFSRPGGFDRWLKLNPKAVEFIDDYLSLRRGGQTDWSIPDVLNYLRSEYGCPAVNKSSLMRWLDRNRYEAWKV